MDVGKAPFILVVGAGVNGLTSAIVLLEAGYRVEIIAEAFSPETTSDVAAAVWYPYLAEPQDKVKDWCRTSYITFQKLSRDAPESGVFMSDTVEFFKAAKPPVHDWLGEWLGEYRWLKSKEIPVGYQSGLSLQVPMIDSSVYMPYLMRRFEALGGKCHRISLTSLTQAMDVPKDKPELLLHCAGLGARQLLGDEGMYPVRGQVLRVKCPDIKETWIDDTDEHFPRYILPRCEDVILGGSAESGSEALAINEALTTEIWSFCKRWQPELSKSELLEVKVGLRPARRGGIRLELELPKMEKEWNIPVLHNYGHGGSGYTLSWGCAFEVGRLVEEFMHAD